VLERLRSKRSPVHPPSTASLQPPRATVHPLSTSSSLHGLLFIQPSPAAVHRASTGSCSSTPNRLGCGGLLGVLFIQRQRPTTTGSCSSNPHWELFIHSQPTGSTHHVSTRSTYRAHSSNGHCSSRGNQHRLARYVSHGGSIGFSVSSSSDRSLGSVSSSSEGIARVQSAANESLGFS
jgi:hypothetical protein